MPPSVSTFRVFTQYDGQPIIKAYQQNGKAFPADASEQTPTRDLVVIADYSLFGRPDFSALTSGATIGLLPPAPREPCTSEEIVDLWLHTPPRRRTHLDPAELASEFEAFVRSRASLARERRAQENLLSTWLKSSAPEYHAILSAKDAWILGALSFLQEFPSATRITAEAVIRLTALLERARGPRAGDLEWVLQVKAADEARSASDSERLYAEHRTAWLANTVLHLDNQIYDLDTRLFALVAQTEHAVLVLSGVAQEPTAQSTPPRRDHPAESTLDFSLNEFLIRRSAHGWDAPGELLRVPTPEAARAANLRTMQLEIAIGGQLAALDAGDYMLAIRYRSICASLLADESDRETGTAEPGKPSSKLENDALLVNALTEAIAVDPMTATQSLRAALAAEECSPQIHYEVLGFYVLILILISEIDRDPDALRQLKATTQESEVAGPMGAAAAIGELFLKAVQPETPDDEVAEVQQRADHNSLGTAYRSYYHWTLMLTTFTTKDVEQGLHSHSQIQREGTWERYRSPFLRLMKFAYSVHLAARGEFARARAEVEAATAFSNAIHDDAEMRLYGLIKFRLELAAGNYRLVLASMESDSPYSAENLRGVHMHRYVASAYMLRGSAYAQGGEHQRADALFMRALETASLALEWMTLLSFETHEFRAWLESKDPDELPDRMSRATYDGILRRPVLISQTLPPLTPQLYRTLSYIAQGRLLSSIASEMNVSLATVKWHVRELYKRLGVSNREQAARKADDYRTVRTQQGTLGKHAPWNLK